jgi:hypothetical protein
VTALCPSYGVGETDPARAAALVKDPATAAAAATGGPA